VFDTLDIQVSDISQLSFYILTLNSDIVVKSTIEHQFAEDGNAALKIFSKILFCLLKKNSCSHLHSFSLIQTIE